MKREAIIGRTWRIADLEFTWWGLSEAYKWRWQESHIDLGPVSIYGRGERLWPYPFWRVIAILIKPLRWWYHRRFR